MANTSEDLTETLQAMSRLAAAMEQLPARYDAVQRANRRLRIALVIFTLILVRTYAADNLILVGGAGYITFASVAQLLGQLSTMAQRLGHASKRNLAAISQQQAEAERKRLLDTLPNDRREKIAAFQQHLHWIRQYLNTSRCRPHRGLPPGGDGGLGCGHA